MRIGFIGLGNMGGPMALNLIKAGHALVVHDVRSELAKAYLERGAKAADNPRGAAQGAQLVLTPLPQRPGLGPRPAWGRPQNQPRALGPAAGGGRPLGPPAEGPLPQPRSHGVDH